ncbi:superoxide dismutase family protein [Pedobacter sp. BS3]|uniref:superoxide dismutase family protein n=1 Tax=Pedobacter sp. BS3 TaxID=2567937 RepID=UPI001F5BA7BE|nr:superoxide dismutase family protein [Pedobacter sp. BS3]
MKKENLFGMMAIALIIAAGCSNNNRNQNMTDSTMAMSDTSMTDSMASGANATMAHADISATKTDTAGTGTADFVKESDGTVQLQLKIHFPSMANKSVAVHIHEHGDCGDSGKMTHGHWNPTHEQHGKWGSASYHSGDIGNVQLDNKGDGELTMKTNRWSIGGDSTTNVVGHGIIVHSGVDDYKSQPAGNAGSRIGCGVITAM